MSVTSLSAYRAARASVESMHPYVTHLQAAGRAPSTIRIRLHYLSTLEREEGAVLRLDRGRLEAFIARRAHLAAETRKSIRASFRSFYRWAHESGLIDRDPSAGLPPVRVMQRPARVARDCDLAAALHRASPRDRALILLARSVCLRRGEIARLRGSDRDDDMLRITGKGGRIRMVWIDPQTARALDELNAGDGYYFPGRFTGHLHPDAVTKILKRTTGWHPHALRHAGASAAYAATNDLRTLQLYLGHASIVTTQRYVTVPDERIAALSAALRLAA